jgi:chitodextrinase
MKTKTYVVIMTGILVLSVCTVLLPVKQVKATGNTIYVDDDNTAGPWDGTQQHPYLQIQYGVNAATNGDTIFVYSGTYTPAGIGKSITLTGEAKESTFIQSPVYTYFTINADHVTVQGFTFGNSTHSQTIFINGNYSILSNNIIYTDEIIGHTYDPVRLTGVTIQDNVIRAVWTQFAYAIRCSHIDQLIIQDNTLINSQYSILIEQPCVGISTDHCNDLTITNNNIQDFRTDMSIFETNNLLLNQNTIDDSHITIADYGLSMSNISNMNVQNNIIRNLPSNGIGIDLYGTNGGTISHNTFSNIGIDGYGIRIDSYSHSYYNRIYENSFSGNKRSRGYAIDYNLNYWYNPDTLRGNTWGNYRGKDGDGDGIGDTPYEIVSFQNQIKDLYPLGVFNNPPNKPTNPSPHNAATGVQLENHYVPLRVTVSDPDGDGLSVRFYFIYPNGITGQMGNIQYVASGDVVTQNLWPSNGLNSWYVIVKDDVFFNDGQPTTYSSGLETISDTFTFSTVSEQHGNIPPIANPGGPYADTVNTTLYFNGMNSHDSDGAITNYTWNFGDNSYGYGPVPTHMYIRSGTFYVHLIVTDNNRSTNISTTSVTISPQPTIPTEPHNIPPVANPGGPYSGFVNKDVHFSGLKYSYDEDGSIETYGWNFGDNSTGYGPTVTHSYAQPGNYTITFWVIDNNQTTTYAHTYANISPSTPGFEFIFVLGAIIATVLLLRRKR